MCVCVHTCAEGFGSQRTLLGPLVLLLRAPGIATSKEFLSEKEAGGPSMYCARWSNEAATVHADITADHRDVPANFLTRSNGVLPCNPQNSVETLSTPRTHRLSVCIPFQSRSNACKVGLRTDPSSCEQQSKCVFATGSH